MKKIVTTLIVSALLLPSFASAIVTQTWSSTSTPARYINPNPIFGNYPNIVVPSINATSTTVDSTFNANVTLLTTGSSLIFNHEDTGNNNSYIKGTNSGMDFFGGGAENLSIDGTGNITSFESWAPNMNNVLFLGTQFASWSEVWGNDGFFKEKLNVGQAVDSQARLLVKDIGIDQGSGTVNGIALTGDVANVYLNHDDTNSCISDCISAALYIPNDLGYAQYDVYAPSGNDYFGSTIVGDIFSNSSSQASTFNMYGTATSTFNGAIKSSTLNGSKGYVLTKEGQLGICDQPNSAYRLDINCDGNALIRIQSNTGVARFDFNGTLGQFINSNGNFFLDSVGSDASLIIRQNPGGIGTTETSRFLANGNLGLGTTSPYARLSVQTKDSTTNLASFATSTGKEVFRINANGTQDTGGDTPTVTCTPSGGSVAGDNTQGAITTGTLSTACTMTFSDGGYPTGGTMSCQANESGIAGVGINPISNTAVTFNFAALTGTVYYRCGHSVK